MLQAPVPIRAAFAANVADVPQIFWFGPALATVGFAVKVMITSSVEATQGEFEIVHLNV